jgi:hypothetical protein
VVRGTHDRIVSQAWAERTVRLLPHGQFAVIPGAAPAVNFSFPREFKAGMLAFLLGAETTVPDSHQAALVPPRDGAGRWPKTLVVRA